MKTLILILVLMPFFIMAETKVSILGDSNTYWYCVPDESFLFYKIAEKNLREKGYEISILRKEKASFGGGQTNEGLERLKILLEVQPDLDIVVLTLGINDALQNRPMHQVKTNIANMIEYAQSHKVKVILGSVDMWWYQIDNPEKNHFIMLYYQLAQTYSVPVFLHIYYDFFSHPENHIGDGIHAKEIGHKVWAINLENAIIPLLK